MFNSRLISVRDVSKGGAIPTSKRCDRPCTGICGFWSHTRRSLGRTGSKLVQRQSRFVASIAYGRTSHRMFHQTPNLTRTSTGPFSRKLIASRKLNHLMCLVSHRAPPITTTSGPLHAPKGPGSYPQSNHGSDDKPPPKRVVSATNERYATLQRQLEELERMHAESRKTVRVSLRSPVPTQFPNLFRRTKRRWNASNKNYRALRNSTLSTRLKSTSSRNRTIHSTSSYKKPGNRAWQIKWKSRNSEPNSGCLRMNEVIWL